MTEVSYPDFCRLRQKFAKHYDLYWKISVPINRYIKNEFFNTFFHRLVDFIFPKSWRDMYMFPYYYEMTAINIRLEGGSNEENYLEDLKYIGKRVLNDDDKPDRIIKMVSTLDDVYFELESGAWLLTNQRIKEV